jgi:hypothetical protein
MYPLLEPPHVASLALDKSSIVTAHLNFHFLFPVVATTRYSWSGRNVISAVNYMNFLIIPFRSSDLLIF